MSVPHCAPRGGMRAAAAALLAPAAVAAAAATTLPALRPRKVTFASTDPIAAQDFVAKYLGAPRTPEGPANASGTCALIKWNTFFPDRVPSDYEWHFVQTSRKRAGPMSLQQLHGFLEYLHGNLSAPDWAWDEFSSFHVGMAAATLDPFVKLLQRDRVPFVARRRTVGGAPLFSVFVEIPHGIVAELVSDTLTAAAAPEWEPRVCGIAAAPFDFAAGFAALRAAEAARPAGAGALPRLAPHHMSYASSDPPGAAAFTAKYMGAASVPQPGLPAQCVGRFALVNFDGSSPWPYYITYAHQPKARTGYYRLKALEAYEEELHGNITEDKAYDQYMDDHVGMNGVAEGSVADDGLDAVLALYKEDRVPYFHRFAGWDGADLFIEAPGGIILEIQLRVSRPADHGLDFRTWALCQRGEMGPGKFPPPPGLRAAPRDP